MRLSFLSFFLMFVLSKLVRCFLSDEIRNNVRIEAMCEKSWDQDRTHAVDNAVSALHHAILKTSSIHAIIGS